MQSALRLALFTALSLSVGSFTAVQAARPKLDAAKAARIATDDLVKLGGNALQEMEQAARRPLQR